MRERLMELFSEFEITGCDNCDGLEKSCRECSLGRIADYLLDNGVIVPPCKVGDKLHKIHTEYTPFTSEIKVEEYGIPYKNVLGHWDIIPFEAIGKTVFLTKEEAEAALKGGAE